MHAFARVTVCVCGRHKAGGGGGGEGGGGESAPNAPPMGTPLSMAITTA